MPELKPFKINKGGLRRSLKVEKNIQVFYTRIKEIKEKVELGKPFKYNGHRVEPTLN